MKLLIVEDEAKTGDYCIGGYYPVPPTQEKPSPNA